MKKHLLRDFIFLLVAFVVAVIIYRCMLGFDDLSNSTLDIVQHDSYLVVPTSQALMILTLVVAFFLFGVRGVVGKFRQVSSIIIFMVITLLLTLEVSGLIDNWSNLATFFPREQMEGWTFNLSGKPPIKDPENKGLFILRIIRWFFLGVLLLTGILLGLRIMSSRAVKSA